MAALQSFDEAAHFESFHSVSIHFSHTDWPIRGKVIHSSTNRWIKLENDLHALDLWRGQEAQLAAILNISADAHPRRLLFGTSRMHVSHDEIFIGQPMGKEAEFTADAHCCDAALQKTSSAMRGREFSEMNESTINRQILPI